jgi:hypothetical protein
MDSIMMGKTAALQRCHGLCHFRRFSARDLALDGRVHGDVQDRIGATRRDFGIGEPVEPIPEAGVLRVLGHRYCRAPVLVVELFATHLCDLPEHAHVLAGKGFEFGCWVWFGHGDLPSLFSLQQQLREPCFGRFPLGRGFGAQVDRWVTVAQYVHAVDQFGPELSAHDLFRVGVAFGVVDRDAGDLLPFVLAG